MVEIRTCANSTFAISAVWCSVESFVMDEKISPIIKLAASTEDRINDQL